MDPANANKVENVLDAYVENETISKDICKENTEDVNVINNKVVSGSNSPITSISYSTEESYADDNTEYDDDYYDEGYNS